MKTPKPNPTPPAPPATASAEQLASIANLSARRIEQLAQAGKIPAPTNGRWPLLPTVTALFAYYQKSRDAEGTAALKDANLKKKNELLDIALAQARHKVIDFAEVEREWSQVLLTVKARLRQIGGKVTPRLKFCQTEGQQQAEIEREIDDALTELSKPASYRWPKAAEADSSEEVETKAEKRCPELDSK